MGDQQQKLGTGVAPVVPERTGPRVVFTAAPLVLATLRERQDDGSWWVQVGANECAAVADSSVDEVLLAEHCAAGRRVVLDTSSDPPLVVGALATQRALTIGPDGGVDAEVENLRISARGEVLLKTSSAYIRAGKKDVELYGERVVSRARGLVKILAAMIKLN